MSMIGSPSDLRGCPGLTCVGRPAVGDADHDLCDVAAHERGQACATPASLSYMGAPVSLSARGL